MRIVVSVMVFASTMIAIAGSPRPLTLGELYLLLWRAIGHGDEVSVEILLKAGADPTGIRGYGDFHKHLDHIGTEPMWPLSQAASGGHLKIVRMLLNAGANPNEEFDEHQTPLTEAARGGYLEVVRVLLDAGADLSHRSAEGTAADLATKNQHPEVAELLNSRR